LIPLNRFLGFSKFKNTVAEIELNKFAQICELKTRERKAFCRMYVMIFYNTENPRDKMNKYAKRKPGRKSAKYSRLTSSQRGLAIFGEAPPHSKAS
jgi:hypothetical protein